MPITQSQFIWDRSYENFHQLSSQAFDRLSEKEQASLLLYEITHEKMKKDSQEKAEKKNLLLKLEALLNHLRNEKKKTNQVALRFKKKKPEEALESFFMVYTDLSIEKITEQLQRYLPSITEKETITASEEKTNYIYYLKISWFIFYSTGLLCFEVLGGMAGIFELCEYLCESFHWAFMPPVVFAASVIFGIVEASVAAVFDVAAVAEKLNIPYLTACRELQILLKQATKLEKINQNIRMAILHLNNGITPQTPEQKKLLLEKHRELQSLLIGTCDNQKYICNKIHQFETAFEKSGKKRFALKVLWTLCAAPLYAAGANMTAVYIFGSAAMMGLPTIGAPIGLMIALAWIAWELYRFSSLEYENMASGVDALLGTPCDQMCRAIALKKTLEAEINKNLQDNQQHIESLEHQIALAERNAKDNGELSKKNAQLKEQNSKLIHLIWNPIRKEIIQRPEPEKTAVINKHHLFARTQKHIQSQEIRRTSLFN